MQHTFAALALIFGLLVAGCSSGVDTPKGSSRGYSSVRLMARAPHLAPEPEYESGQQMIRGAISAQCSANGLRVTSGAADLVIAHLVVLQDNAMTTYLEDFYGAGADAESIADVAHERGVIKGKRRDYFQQAGLVIDVLDARTNKLVFRNYVKRDMLPEGASDSARRQVINQAVAETLAPFFR
jgi:hypothetical protein